MSLKAEVDLLIAAYKEPVSIYMYHANKLVYSHLAHEQLPAASVIKLAILATQLTRHEDLEQVIDVSNTPQVGGAGVLHLLDQSKWTIQDLLKLMITVSDNYAANVMIDHLSMAAINQWLAQNSYQETQLQRRLMDTEAVKAGRENVISAADALRLFRYLLKTFPQTQNWFLNQQFRGKLPLTMDETTADVQIYNKTGEGPFVDHDVARFTKNGQSMDVAVLTNGFTDRLAVISMMAAIGQLIYRAL
ncbi:serine hydrolase [Secundilactobacillus hailunensis]|uniref:Serine hydrolase n=1 Tax=Secundilactobacillus hailunensis TaxID=2559923 RepID=A0ABW1TCP4_9LACO|nr:serine hydrolase [Secundilactobacillus hailunensis]